MFKFRHPEFFQSVVTLIALAVLIPLARTGTLGVWARELVQTVSNDELNAIDADIQILSYYDAVQTRTVGPSILDMGAIPTSGGRVPEFAGEDVERFEETEAVQLIDGFLHYELKPNIKVIYRDVPLITNRWGQRDRDYEKTKPADAFRIALVGASVVMGSGVTYEDIFATVLEDRLQQKLAGSGAYQQYELINFGVNGYFLVEFVHVIEHIVPEFEPDLILLCLARADRRLLPVRVGRRLYLRPSIESLEYDFLKDIVERADLNEEDFSHQPSSTQGLIPFRDELVSGCLREISTISTERGIPVAVLVLHREVGEEVDEDTLWIANQSEQAGLPTLRIFDAYSGSDDEGMYLSDADRHPTPKAHRMLSDNILEQMLKDRQVRRLLLRKPSLEVDKKPVTSRKRTR